MEKIQTENNNTTSLTEEISIKIRLLNKEFDIKISKADTILKLKQKIEQVSTKKKFNSKKKFFIFFS